LSVCPQSVTCFRQQRTQQATHFRWEIAKKWSRQNSLLITMDRAGLTALNYGGDHYCPGASRQGNGIFPPPEIDGCQDRTFFGHRKRPSRFLSGDSLVFARASLRLRESPGTKQTVPSFLCFYYWCLRPVMTIGPLSIDFASARFYPKASGPPCAPRCAQPEETPWAFGPGRQEPAARATAYPSPSCVPPPPMARDDGVCSASLITARWEGPQNGLQRLPHPFDVWLDGGQLFKPSDWRFSSRGVGGFAGCLCASLHAAIVDAGLGPGSIFAYLASHCETNRMACLGGAYRAPMVL